MGGKSEQCTRVKGRKHQKKKLEEGKYWGIIAAWIDDFFSGSAKVTLTFDDRRVNAEWKKGKRTGE